MVFMCGKTLAAELRDQALVKLDCFEQLGLGNIFAVGMSDVDGAGADQEGLAPSAVEGRDVGGEGDDGGFKAVERAEFDGRDEQHFFGAGIG